MKIILQWIEWRALNDYLRWKDRLSAFKNSALILLILFPQSEESALSSKSLQSSLRSGEWNCDLTTRLWRANQWAFLADWKVESGEWKEWYYEERILMATCIQFYLHVKILFILCNVYTLPVVQQRVFIMAEFLNHDNHTLRWGIRGGDIWLLTYLTATPNSTEVMSPHFQ